MTDREPPDSTPHHLHLLLSQQPSLFVVIHPTRGLDGVRRAVETATLAGADGVFLIDQGASGTQVVKWAREVRAARPDLWMGVNLLGLTPGELIRHVGPMREGGAELFNGIWTDDCGAYPPGREQPWEDVQMASIDADWFAPHFGGVAFKGQEPVPEDELEATVRWADRLCTVVTTSGPATGIAPTAAKVARMRAALDPRVPLALASGVNAGNVEQFLPYARAFLVGTGVERDMGLLDPARVRELALIIHSYEPRKASAP